MLERSLHGTHQGSVCELAGFYSLHGCHVSGVFHVSDEHLAILVCPEVMKVNENADHDVTLTTVDHTHQGSEVKVKVKDWSINQPE